MKKIKVLFLVGSNKFSGAENVVCTIINNISDKYDCAYCCPAGPIKEQLQEKNIKYFPLKKLSHSELNKVVKEYKPDIIHAHDYRASFLAAFFHKKCQIISHIHVNNPLMQTKNLKSFLYKKLSKRYKKIIWVSDSALDNYYYKDSVAKKSMVLYNVIDKNDIIRRAEEYSIKKKYDLIFLGRLSVQKNPERLVSILSKLKEKMQNFKIAIVGTGDKEKLIKDLVIEHKLDNNVDFYGFQSNPYPILKNSKILIMTSLWEGTPMVSLEAQALGKPIISTPVDGLKKIIINDYNGFLSDSDEEIIEKILSYSNKNQYEKLQNNINENFVKINDSNSYFKTIEETYKM